MKEEMEMNMSFFDHKRIDRLLLHMWFWMMKAAYLNRPRLQKIRKVEIDSDTCWRGTITYIGETEKKKLKL